MKIATMVRSYMPVPRPSDILYAPIDLAVAISEGLASRGHDITFYAPEGSKLSPNIHIQSLGLQPLIHNEKQWVDHLNTIKPHLHYVPWLYDNKYVQDMFERASQGEYDALFFHHPELPLPYAQRYPDVKVISTLHDPLYDWYAKMFDMYPSPNAKLVSISNNQRDGRPDLNWAKTIYNGVNTRAFAFSEKPGDYLFFSGRIVPEKGVAQAVQIARATGERLVIAGLVFPNDQAYFDEHIKPYLNDKITYVGYIQREKLASYYQNAKALLVPVQWAEPFGMTMVEAMACGTPVIALNAGSIPEVIAHGKTGFVVDTIEDMNRAISQLDTIKRKDCRERVEKLFSVDTMVQSYEQLFLQESN